MEFDKYLERNKELYNLLIEFVDYEKDDFIELDKLISFINEKEINKRKDEFMEFLYLLSHIFNHRHRVSNFINKIERILSEMKEDIQKIFHNYEIFQFFESSKRILYFLFKEGIIIFNQDITNLMILPYSIYQETNYLFFLRELKPFISDSSYRNKEKELHKNKEDIFDNIEEYNKERERGENTSYISQLIREDSVEEFISYTQKHNLKLSMKINKSAFESNSFLEKKKPTLIEYAAFFGSI